MAVEQRRTVPGIIASAFGLLFKHPLIFLAAALPQLVLSLATRPVPRADFDSSASFSIFADQFQSRWRALWRDPSTPHTAVPWDAVPGGTSGWQYVNPLPNPGGGEIAAALSLVGIVMVIGAAIMLCVSVFRSAATSIATGELLGGRRPSIGQVFRTALERVPSLAFVTVLIGLLMLPVVILAYGFAVAGAYLGAPVLTRILGTVVAVAWVATVYFRFALTVPAVVVGGYRGVAALRRSDEFWQQSWRRVLGVLFGTLLVLVVLRVGVVSVAKCVALIAEAQYYFGPPMWVRVLEQMALTWCNQLMAVAVVVLYVEASAGLESTAIADPEPAAVSGAASAPRLS